MLEMYQIEYIILVIWYILCKKNGKKFKIMLNLVDINALKDYDSMQIQLNIIVMGQLVFIKILEKFLNYLSMIKNNNAMKLINDKALKNKEIGEYLKGEFKILIKYEIFNNSHLNFMMHLRKSRLN